MKNVVTFGEIMLRLSTQYGDRITQSLSFNACYGGAEANVAVSLANFGCDVNFISKIPDNLLGRAVKEKLHSKGVRTEFLLMGGERLGTYYLEVGSGNRGDKVIYDRKYSSFSRMSENELDWDVIFKGVDVFFVSGITMALSIEMQKIVQIAITKAKSLGVKVYFDFNYRSKLWTQNEAASAFKTILPMVDACSAGSLDAIYLLGIDKPDGPISEIEELHYFCRKIQEMYPNIKRISSMSRNVVSASANELTGNIFVDGSCFQSKKYMINPIVDRVGGGDAYMAGIIYADLKNMPPQDTVNFATAASALKHTVRGDCNVFNEEEINEFIENSSAKIVR